MSEFLTLNAGGLSEATVLAGRDQALAQIKWMRQYTLQLIEAVPQELWYVMPAGSATHLAWQVGHIAVAQYGLMLFRQRGRVESDMELMPGWLRKNFGKGSSPAALVDDAKRPSPESLLERLNSIHAEGCETVAGLAPETLLQPSDMPYVAYANNLGALLFCPLHESIHAGQIGLLRRLHGLAPLR
ncbi:MAG: DinB family protein [Aureliella sp.]